VESEAPHTATCNAKLFHDKEAEEFGSNEHVNLSPMTLPWNTHTLHRIRFKVETCKWIETEK
jgi:hypothetical protein